jgi:predicted transcriptional regulator
MASVIIRLPDKDKHMLELLAQHQATTVSELVRQAVATMVEKATSQVESKKENSLLALGKLAEEQAKKLKLTDGPTDLSVTFKEILYK